MTMQLLCLWSVPRLCLTNANACACSTRSHCISLLFGKGCIQRKRIIFYTWDLQLGTRGQFHPPLVSTYTEIAAFAAKKLTCECSWTEVAGIGRSYLSQGELADWRAILCTILGCLSEPSGFVTLFTTVFAASECHVSFQVGLLCCDVCTTRATCEQMIFNSYIDPLIIM